MAKKITNSIDVDGSVSADAVQRRTGGTANEVFTTDGGLTDLPSLSGSENDGLKYFKAAYKSGLTFLVTAEWQLGGVLFLMRQSEITLAAADPTLDRIDVIAVDDTGAIIVLQGTAAVTPVKPTIDPITQLEGTFVTIPAGSAIPAGTVVTDVYFENLGTAGGEWDGLQTGGSITLGSTVDPISGSVSIEGTGSVSGHQIIFTPAAAIDLQAQPMKQLNYLIRNKATINGKGDTHRFIFNGLDGAGNPVSIVLPADPTYSLSTTNPQFLSLNTPDYTQIKTLQNIQFAINSKSAFGFFLDEIRLVETPITAVDGDWATVEYVDEKVAFLEGMDIEDGVITGTTSKNLALNRFNGQVINIPFTDETGGGGGTVTQTDLVDAATLSWDINAVPSAYLLATSAVGDTRFLPNTSLVNCVDGVNYQLTFQQDATGGRTVTFDTNFEVVGSFDLRANTVSIILINFQDGVGRVVVTNWEGILHGLSNVGTGAEILVGDTLKTLKQGANITLTESATEILIEAASGGGGGGGSIGYEMLYLSFIGDDATAEVGNPNLPFLTPNAAFAAVPDAVNIHLLVINGNSTFTWTSQLNTNTRLKNIRVSHKQGVNPTFVFNFPDAGFGNEVYLDTFEIYGKNMFVVIHDARYIFISHFVALAYSMKFNVNNYPWLIENCKIYCDQFNTVDSYPYAVEIYNYADIKIRTFTGGSHATNGYLPISIRGSANIKIGKATLVEGGIVQIIPFSITDFPPSVVEIGDVNYTVATPFGHWPLIKGTNTRLIFNNSVFTSVNANHGFSFEIINDTGRGSTFSGVIEQIKLPQQGSVFFARSGAALTCDGIIVLSTISNGMASVVNGFFGVFNGGRITVKDCFVNSPNQGYIINSHNNVGDAGVVKIIGKNTFITANGLNNYGFSPEVINVEITGHLQSSVALANSTYLTYSVTNLPNTYS